MKACSRPDVLDPDDGGAALEARTGPLLSWGHPTPDSVAPTFPTLHWLLQTPPPTGASRGGGVPIVRPWARTGRGIQCNEHEERVPLRRVCGDTKQSPPPSICGPLGGLWETV